MKGAQSFSGIWNQDRRGRSVESAKASGDVEDEGTDHCGEGRSLSSAVQEAKFCQ